MYDKIEKLYGRIGKKIKILAFILFAVSCVSAVISSVIVFPIMYAIERDDFLLYLPALGVGIIAAIIASLICFFVTWPLYSMGEMVDKLYKIELNTRGDSPKSDTQVDIEEDRLRKVERLRAKKLIDEDEYSDIVSK